MKRKYNSQVQGGFFRRFSNYFTISRCPPAQCDRSTPVPTKRYHMSRPWIKPRKEVVELNPDKLCRCPASLRQKGQLIRRKGDNSETSGPNIGAVVYSGPVFPWLLCLFLFASFFPELHRKIKTLAFLSFPDRIGCRERHASGPSREERRGILCPLTNSKTRL